jgi:hypothetical protein
MSYCTSQWAPICPPTPPQQFVPSGQTSLAAGTVSTSVTFPSAGSNLTVVIFNAGPNTVYVVAGNSSVVATPAGVPVLPSGMVTFPQGFATNIAAITIMGTAALTIQSGVGCVNAVYPAFGFTNPAENPLTSVAINLIGTGTGQTTALLLPAFTNIIATATPPTGFILNGALGSANIVVQDDDPTNSAPIWPPVGAQINALGTNVAFDVGSGGQRITFSTNSAATQWYAG